jgi:voltage-gated potassium channel
VIPVVVLEDEGVDSESKLNGPGLGAVALDVVMVLLAVCSIVMLAYDELANPSPEVHKALVQLDWLVVGIFVVEYAYRLWRTPNRGAFLKKNWWELPGMIPMAAGEAGFLRAFRLARLARLTRLVRAVAILARLRRVNRMMGRFVSRSYLAQTATVTALVVIGGSIAVWLFERDAGGPIVSFSEALWWAIVTVTTVGYGDITPVTAGGRVVATIMMFTGIGLVGILAATLSRAMIRTGEESTPSVAAELERLESLRARGALSEEEFVRAKAAVLGA